MVSEKKLFLERLLAFEEVTLMPPGLCRARRKKQPPFEQTPVNSNMSRQVESVENPAETGLRKKPSSIS